MKSESDGSIQIIQLLVQLNPDHVLKRSIDALGNLFANESGRKPENAGITGDMSKLRIRATICRAYAKDLKMKFSLVKVVMNLTSPNLACAAIH